MRRGHFFGLTTFGDIANSDDIAHSEAVRINYARMAYNCRHNYLCFGSILYSLER